MSAPVAGSSARRSIPAPRRWGLRKCSCRLLSWLRSCKRRWCARRCRCCRPQLKPRIPARVSSAAVLTSVPPNRAPRAARSMRPVGAFDRASWESLLRLPRRRIDRSCCPRRSPCAADERRAVQHLVAAPRIVSKVMFLFMVARPDTELNCASTRPPPDPSLERILVLELRNHERQEVVLTDSARLAAALRWRPRRRRPVRACSAAPSRH